MTAAVDKVLGTCERCAWDVLESEDSFTDGDTIQHERCYDDDPEDGPGPDLNPEGDPTRNGAFA